MSVLASNIPAKITAAATTEPISSAAPVAERFHLRQASWELFSRFYDESSEQRLRLTYADGEMCFMSPLPMHESWKEMIGTFIQDLCTELGIKRRSLGSTTWIKPTARKGIEADESYYIASEPAVRGKTSFDLTRDPPPDLAVEIDVTHSPIDRPAIYAALGVPELWVFNGATMTFFKLVEGQYAVAERSVSFPFLAANDIERHLAMMPTVDETTIVRAWRAFVREKNPTPPHA